MLSDKIKSAVKIFLICMRCPEFHVGDTFKEVVVADEDDGQIKLSEEVCFCGKISDDEVLFRSADGSVYFSICGGWGERHGTLYGLEMGIFFDFGHPTTEETILFECKNSLGTYHTWGGAMAYRSRKYKLETIAEVMKKKLG